MSKGVGHVGRAIAALFDDEPDNAFTTFELCVCAYGDDWANSRSERVAVLRAVKSLARHRPDLALDAYEMEARGGEFAFYRRDRVLSYAMARMKGANRWEREEDELRARIMPGGDHHHYTQPVGAWLLRTEMAIARRDGDYEKFARLEAEYERWLAALIKGVRAAFGKQDGEPP
jgi:hypothetical protein